MPGMLLDRIYNAKWLIFGVALLLLLLWIMRPFLDVFVYAIFLYYITRPIKRRLSKYIKNDSLVVAVSLWLLALPIILVITYTLLYGLSQMNTVIQGQGLSGFMPARQLTNLTNAFSDVQQNVTSGNFSLNNLGQQGWYRVVSNYSDTMPMIQSVLIATGSTIADIVFKLFLIFFIAFGMLRYDAGIARWFSGTFSRFMAEYNGLLPRYVQGVDSDLQKIFFGNLLTIISVAILAVVTFNVINVIAPVPQMQIPVPILLGVLCGVSSLIPIVGMWLVVGPLMLYILAASILAGTFMPNLGFFILIFIFIFIVVTTLPQFVVTPYIARGQVNSSLLIFAYLIGPLVFGITGIFLGAIVLVLLTNYVNIVLPEISG
jgi:predicted PurR-regulated permease PerM